MEPDDRSTAGTPPRSELPAGYALALVGVVIFGLTLPATRIAVAELPPVFVGLGRAVLAAIAAALLLALTRPRAPRGSEWRRLALAAVGVVFGFPLFSAIAMQWAPASHGGVVLGILPLATALAAVLFAGERPSPGFWLCSTAGAAAVVTFALLDGGAELHAADSLLVLAVASAGIGYAASGQLARTLGGWQVIAWALVVSLPVLLAPVVWVLPQVDLAASPAAWMGFLYVALASQFLGFFFWNAGLARAGVARAGQTQLLQPFVTIVASAALLGEAIQPITVLFAAIVVACVALSRRMRVRSEADP